MKKLIAYLFLGLAAAFVSCGDENTDNENKWFLTPQAAVSGTTAEVSCVTRFGEGVLENTAAGFIYAAVGDNGIGDFSEAPGTVSGNTLRSTLAGLQPETVYFIYAYADLPTGRMQSGAAAFETGKGDIPDPDPEKPAFGTPSASEITTTTAKLNCGFTFDEESADYSVYFRYKLANSVASGFSTVGVSSGTGTKTAALTDLAPGTEYEFQLCADWNGKTYASATAKFTTGKQGGGGSGVTKFTGWAELLAEEDVPGDYYYAYHYCDGKPGARNYTVCYSKELRGAVWVAYPMHKCYTEGDAGGRNDSWKYDPIIPNFVQPNLSSSYKSSGDGSYSRGHMLASNDRQSDKATNRQTFYYTNMSPQIQDGFNGGIWATLEKSCHSMICSDTLYMVTGAYFANENKHCEDKNGNTVVVPTHFYKVLIRSKSGDTGKPIWTLTADQIECAGYWFEHKVYSGSKPAQFIKSVSWIEQQTGMTFFPNVPNAPKDKLDTSFWKI